MPSPSFSMPPPSFSMPSHSVMPLSRLLPPPPPPMPSSSVVSPISSPPPPLLYPPPMPRPSPPAQIELINFINEQYLLIFLLICVLINFVYFNFCLLLFIDNIIEYIYHLNLISVLTSIY